MSRRVSWRWLAGVLIVVLGGSVGLFFLHTRQFQRHIAALRTDIDRAEKEGDQERLQRLLERSLVLAPDGDSRARYGLLLARRARSPADSRRAAAVLSRVRPAQLRDYRSRYPEVRRTCVQLQITLGDHAAAKRDIERYLDEHKGEPDSSIGELEALKGECSAALGDNSAAEQSFTRAIAHAPARVESWVKLAELYQGALQRPAKAEKVMNDLVAANKRLPAPWLARARFRLGRRQMALAEADAKQARTLAPEDPGVLAVCGEIAAKRGRLDEARADLERALMRDSNRPALYVLLARVHQQAKRPADAIAMLKRGVERVAESERVLLQLELIDVAVALGELAEAEKTIARLRRNGSSPLLRLYEARLRLQQGQYRQAAELLEADRKVWAQATQFGARACAVLGECYAKLGNIDRHLEAHRLAVGMDAHSAPARLALASSLLDLGNYSEAITQLRQLVQDPDAAGTYTDPDGPERARRLLARAMVLHNLTLPPRARSWREVEEILAKAPAAQTILLRAEVLMAQGQAEGAGLLLAAARDANPGSPDLWAAAADWLDRQGQPECALALLAAGRDRLGACWPAVPSSLPMTTWPPRRRSSRCCSRSLKRTPLD
jgi:tetratricopeptide (TPR) repeat protein